MAWKKTDQLVNRRLNQKGLGGIVRAGLICRKAEELYPTLFKAVSARHSTLHLQLSKNRLLEFKMIEGKLLQELTEVAAQHHLTAPNRVRLTFLEDLPSDQH